jgi:hypothetical protein
MRKTILFTLSILLILSCNSNSKQSIKEPFQEELSPSKTIHATEQTTSTPLGKVKAIPLPKTIAFCNEKAPLNQQDIKERLDKEMHKNVYYQSNALLIFKRANRYFPIIEPILKKEGVPDDFKYLAVIESTLENVTSPAGAKGIWQFMKGTAKGYGIEVNKNVDERYNIEKATVMAAKYLKEAKAKFGSWTLAAAAYNAGNKRIQDNLDKQLVKNYYDLKLNNETARYVFRILALKEIIENPDKYGFEFSQEDLYPMLKYKKIKITKSIDNLAEFAKKQGVNYKILKLYNPWLLQNKLKNKSGKTYYIKIPVD